MTTPTENLKGLEDILSPDLIKTELDVLDQYTIDQRTPRAVIFPTTTEQVADVVRFSNKEGLSILPWGSGSKMTTGHPLDRLDLVVCTARLNHMIDVDSENLTMTIEAGVKYRDIQARLATEDDRCYLPLQNLETEGEEIICSDRSHKGCFLPIDPPFSDRATIGGILASNSSGPRRLLYGLPRDMVLGVRFVTPSGEIVGVGGKTVKNVSGYDVSKLIIGSVGSLGILCEVTLRVLPLPECMETVLLSFGTLSGVADFVDSLLETQLLPAAVEVMNQQAFVNLSLQNAPLLNAGDYVVAVALESFEEPLSRMKMELEGMAGRLETKLNTRIQEREHLRFWLAVGNLMPSDVASSLQSIAVQLSYPLSKWHGITAAAVEALSSMEFDYTLLTHAGSGQTLINLIANDPEDDDWTTMALQGADDLLKLCHKEGGHLIFLTAPTELKDKLPIWGEPRSDWPIMKRLKERMDPTRLMSPGRFIGRL